MDPLTTIYPPEREETPYGVVEKVKTRTMTLEDGIVENVEYLGNRQARNYMKLIQRVGDETEKAHLN